MERRTEPGAEVVGHVLGHLQDRLLFGLAVLAARGVEDLLLVVDEELPNVLLAAGLQPRCRLDRNCRSRSFAALMRARRAFNVCPSRYLSTGLSAARATP
jgi:hypothetical protein